jgi:hypothetical protein
MPTRRFGILMSGLALAALAAAAQAAPAAPGDLIALLPAAKKMPACAKTFVPQEDYEAPCDGAPPAGQASNDPRFVSCMAGLLVTTAKAEGVKAEQATGAAMATFESGGELNVLAVAFVDEPAATAVAAGLEKVTAATPARAAVHRRGSAVAFASCDAQFDPACCRQVLAAVSETWKKP